MYIQLIEPDEEFRAILTFLLQCDGHTVTEGDTIPSPEALVAVQLLIIRDELLDRATWGQRHRLTVPASPPTLVLTAASEPAVVAARLGIPTEHCIALPLIPARLRERLARLAGSAPDSGR